MMDYLLKEMKAAQEEMLERMETSRQKDMAQLDANRKTDKEELKAEMQSMRSELDESLQRTIEAVKAKTAAMRENIGTNHKEMVAKIIPDSREETMACREMSEEPIEEKETMACEKWRDVRKRKSQPQRKRNLRWHI